MRRQETVTEQLRYKFTPEQHLENTSLLVGKLGDAGDFAATAKAVKANLKEREVAIDAEVARLARLVRDGFDVRDVQCRWDYGRPSENQKTLVRLDSNEDVRTEMMLPHERQEMLKFEAPAHVLSGRGSLKDKKVTEVPDSDIDYYASRDTDDLLRHQWIQTDVDAVFAEAKRRADVKESAANNVTQMPAPGGPVLAVALAAASPVEDAPIEEAHTLPSARAVEGPKRGRRSHAPTPLPSAEEREALEQLQAENAPVETLDPRDEAPEL